MILRYALEIPVRREARYESIGVPAIDLWAAGDDMIFRRMTGIVDSGASRTILGFGSRALLGIRGRSRAEQITIPGGIDIEYEVHRVQFRLPLAGAPPVSFCLDVGVNEFGHNFFGADLLQYFTVAIAPDLVVFMADAE